MTDEKTHPDATVHSPHARTPKAVASTVVETLKKITTPEAPAPAEPPAIVEHTVDLSKCINCGQPSIAVTPPDGSADQVAYCKRCKPANVPLPAPLI